MMGWNDRMEDDLGMNDFLRTLLDNGHLKGTAAEGITKLVIDKGRNALSPDQDAVFERYVIDEYTRDHCESCSSNIPWSEMYEAIDNGGNCAHCDIELNRD